MADQTQQVYPAPRENGFHAKHDMESAAVESRELRKKKRLKCFAYIVAFIVFQTGIITLFGLTIMKVRTPKFRVQSANFESFSVGTAANPSFNLRMNAQMGIKNTNFGRYKYQNSTIVFYYDSSPVGEVSLPNSKVGWRTTKKVNVVIDLSSNSLPANSQLGSELNSGVLTLKTQARLNGKVELLQFMFKKKKSTNMDCTITIGVPDQIVRQISCK